MTNKSLSDPRAPLVEANATCHRPENVKELYNGTLGPVIIYTLTNGTLGPIVLLVSLPENAQVKNLARDSRLLRSY